jgi:hypothetical protein
MPAPIVNGAWRLLETSAFTESRRADVDNHTGPIAKKPPPDDSGGGF